MIRAYGMDNHFENGRTWEGEGTPWEEMGRYGYNVMRPGAWEGYPRAGYAPRMAFGYGAPNGLYLQILNDLARRGLLNGAGMETLAQYYEMGPVEGIPFQRPTPYGSRSFRGQFQGRGPRGFHRSDERITEELNERIARLGIDAEEVEVRVREGEVTLTGIVYARMDKRLIEDVAEDVYGVVDVHNELRVSRTEPRGNGPRTTRA